MCNKVFFLQEMYMLSVTDFDSFIDPYKYQIDLYNEPSSSVFLAGQASH